MPDGLVHCFSPYVLGQQDGDIADPVEGPQLKGDAHCVRTFNMVSQHLGYLRQVVIGRTSAVIHPGVYGMVVHAHIHGEVLQREGGLLTLLVEKVSPSIDARPVEQFQCCWRRPRKMEMGGYPEGQVDDG